MKRIDPQPASGFRDFLPEDAAARQGMCDTIAEVFGRFGFVTVDTPALERLEVLSGGEAQMDKQVFRTRLADDQEDLGLRFDLTVPLARYVAAHAERLTMPFRRYHIGKVWRGEHAQAGRFREFVQCDADIVGAKDVAADAEIISLMHETLVALGVSQFMFRIGHRKLLNGLAEFAQFPAAKTGPVLRAVDKMDKVGWEGVRRELKEKSKLDATAVDSIRAFLDASEGQPEDVIKKIAKLLEFSAEAHEGVHELQRLIECLDALHVPRERWRLDLSIARGLGYYTGPVFETTLTALPDLGSICSGGRYDALVSRFAPMDLSATGASIGLDRLFAALDALELVPRVRQGGRIAVLNFHGPAMRACLNLASRLRNAGLSAFVYLGGEETLKGQLAWAVKHEVPYVAIIGQQELENGTCQLKDIAARSQTETALGDAAESLKRMGA
ncbi:MAG TPA: histidine--tRNA ligase [Candidatus Paceibacterota bacterium]|nr:histidine--tRNA ligase [Candidatus Paceibacterota bacterium]